MMDKPIFGFDGYTVRPVEEKDRAYLTHLITNDPYHRETMDADWFLSLQRGEDAWAIEDERGHILLYFKTQTAVRLSLQFAQGEGREQKYANAVALIKGLDWIEMHLRMNGFREILFQTDGPELKEMAKRRMGFRELPGELVRGVTPSLPCQASHESAIQDCTIYGKEG
jgi:hypothetical protein